MTALLIIVLLTGVVLLTPVGMRVEYAQNRICLDVRIGWLWMHISPKKPRKSRKKSKKSSTKIKKSETQEATASTSKKQKLSFSFFLELVKLGLRAAKIFLKGIAIDRLYACITVAGTDAAKSALLYGRLCAAVSTLHVMLDNFFNLKNYDVQPLVDFCGEKTEFEGQVVLSFLLYSAFGAAFCFLFAFLKMKIKEKIPGLFHGGNYERV